MTGPYYDDDEPEEFRPVPHPDDRLWRHPSEIAAMHAAHANAETAKVPVVQILDPTPKSRLHAGLMVAAGIVVIGAAALTVGVVSSQSSPQSTASDQGVVLAAPLAVADTGPSNPIDVEQSTEIAADVNLQGEAHLTSRIYAQVTSSLPRIQAVTANGMREGSGMFVTDDGHIATSASLLVSAEYVLAWTDDGQRWKAHLVASDPISDVAVLQIESGAWPAVSLGDGRDLRVGQYALALDHDHDAISVGEVTSVSSPLLVVEQPAAVPGSAIVDDTGAVIAMITGDGTNNHGTRAWMLEKVAVDLIASGQASHNSLGLVVSGVPGADMIVVDDVMPDSPAERAQLRPGDLIDTFDGDPVVDAASWFQRLQQAEAGDDAVLTVTRNGSRRIVIAILAELER